MHVRDEVMSIEDLAFQKDKNNVEYAYYKKGENQRIGYIRLQPNVVKKLCKSKQFNLVRFTIHTLRVSKNM